jgi:hypothetical protein
MSRRWHVHAARCIQAHACGSNGPIRTRGERREDVQQRPGGRRAHDSLSAGGCKQSARRASNEAIEAAPTGAGDKVASQADVA